MNKSLWFYYCIPIIDRERKLEENDDSTLYATFFFLYGTAIVALICIFSLIQHVHQLHTRHNVFCYTIDQQIIIELHI